MAVAHPLGDIEHCGDLPLECPSELIEIMDRLVYQAHAGSPWV
jgi:hypothetical protein